MSADRCSFCEKSIDEVKKLAGDSHASICNECIDLYAAEIDEDRQRLLLPLIPLRERVQFPRVRSVYPIGRPATLQAVGKALAGSGQVFAVKQLRADDVEPARSDCHAVGVVSKIVDSMPLPNDELKVALEGQGRARVLRFVDVEGVPHAEVELLPTHAVDPQFALALSVSLVEVLTDEGRVEDLEALQEMGDDPSDQADALAARLDFTPEEKQSLLETTDACARLLRIRRHIAAIVEKDAADAESSAIDARIARAATKVVEQQGTIYLLQIKERLIRDEIESMTGGARPSNAPAAPKVLTAAEIHAALSERVVGQEWAKRDVAVAVYKHLQRLSFARAGGPCPDKENVLLIGPTGCGKTLIGEALSHLVGVPLVVADATTLSETGYVGDDVETMLTSLLSAAGNDIGRAETGIVFIDEIDKVAKRTTRINRDISGEGVQRGLLRMLQGGKVRVDTAHRNKNPAAPAIEIDTTHILFICAGAFSGMPDDAGTVTDALVTFGLLPELVGRFACVTTLGSLQKEELIAILTMPVFSPIAEAKRYFELQGVELVFEQEALSAIAEAAIRTRDGARGLRRAVSVCLRDVHFAISGRQDVATCLVTAENIERGTPPRVMGRDGAEIEIGSVRPPSPARRHAADGRWSLPAG